MAGRQRTFELIPTSLAKSNSYKPPMTSKAAKKAHQLANRGPRISRAEQRRRDAEELAQQKKEYERERASARAKAAREKKAAKEQVEKDARKNMGLPEPSRFVRASQPTISRFVRNGNKNTWLEVDNPTKVFESAVCDEETDKNTLPEPPAKKVKRGDESEDEYGGFPSFSETDIGAVLEYIDSSALSKSVQIDKPVVNVRPALQERSINMPPPPLPMQKRPISFAPSPPKSRKLPRPISKLASPPSATQAFIEDHLDDFFPSPSQEIRELLDDIEDIPSNTQIARELEPSLPPAKVPEEEPFADLICTQSFILSSQDIIEISPCPPPPKPMMGQPKSTPSPPSKPALRQLRRRFFEEKEEDLVHAAIQESKLLAAVESKSMGMNESHTAAAMREAKDQGAPGRTKRDLKRTLSNATDYGEDEFYDCEEELLALC